MPLYNPPSVGGGVNIADTASTVSDNTVVFSNSNGVSFGLSGSTMTATVATNYQSPGAYLTTAMASNRGTDFVQATAGFAGTSASGTIASNGISVSVGPYITTAMLSNRGSDFVQAAAAFAGTSASGTIASNGISVSIGPYLTTAMNSTSRPAFSADASSTFQTLTFQNSNLVSFSNNAGAIRVTHDLMASSSRPAFSADASSTFQTLTFQGTNNFSFSNNAGAIRASHNLAGTSTGFAGANISMSMTHNSSGLNISASVAAPGAAAENNWFNLLGANTAGNTTASGSTIGLSGVGVTLSGTNNSVIVVSAGGANRSFHEIIDGERLTTAFRMTQTQFTKRPILQPFWLDGGNLSCKTVRFLASCDASSNTLSMNLTHGVAFYTMANSTSLALVSSTTNAISLTASSQWSGVGFLDVTGLSDFVLSEGRYVLAYYVSGSNNSSAVQNFRLYGADPMPNYVRFISAGTDQTGATNATKGPLPFWGVYSATTAAFPANIGKSDMSMQSSGVMQDLYAIIMEIS